MLNFGEKKSLTIEEVKGGYILEWRNDEMDRDDLRWGGIQKHIPTSGREIYTNKNSLMKRVKEFF